MFVSRLCPLSQITSCRCSRTCYCLLPQRACGVEGVFVSPLFLRTVNSQPVTGSCRASGLQSDRMTEAPIEQEVIGWDVTDNSFG